MRAIFRRQNTMRISQKENQLEKAKIKTSRIKREFGNDITNCNEKLNKTQNNVFFEALQTLIDNQNKLKNIQKLDTEIYKPSQCNSDKNKMETEPIENVVQTVPSLKTATSPSPEDPQKVAEYQSEIFECLRQADNEYLCEPNYMSVQEDINDRMRSILIDWLIEVYFKFKLQSETLFLTVNIIDRYLSKNQTPRSRLQLVGITAMFIATKYEEIYPPDVAKLVYITDNAYQKQDVLNLEMNMLSALNFDITVPTPLKFFDFIKLKFNLSGLDQNKILYLLFLNLMNGKVKHFSPFTLITAATCLICKSLKNSLLDFYGNKDNFVSVKNCMVELVKYYHKSNESDFNLNGVKKIFSLPKFDKVSLLKYDF